MTLAATLTPIEQLWQHSIGVSVAARRGLEHLAGGERQDEGTDRLEPQQANGAAHGVDRLGQAEEGRVDHLQQARRAGGIGCHHVADLTRRGLRIVDEAAQVLVHEGRRRQLLRIGQQLLHAGTQAEDVLTQGGIALVQRLAGDIGDGGHAGFVGHLGQPGAHLLLNRPKRTGLRGGRERGRRSLQLEHASAGQKALAGEDAGPDGGFGGRVGGAG